MFPLEHSWYFSLSIMEKMYFRRTATNIIHYVAVTFKSTHKTEVLLQMDFI